MKPKLLTLVTLTFLFFSSTLAQNEITNKLIGKWEAKDDVGVTGSLNFIDKENIILTIPGQTLPKGNYILDTTKNPMWIDISIKNGNKIFSAKGLLQLINQNAIKFQVFNEGDRINGFSNENSSNTIILKRKEESKD